MQQANRLVFVDRAHDICMQGVQQNLWKMVLICFLILSFSKFFKMVATINLLVKLRDESMGSHGAWQLFRAVAGLLCHDCEG